MHVCEKKVTNLVLSLAQSSHCTIHQTLSPKLKAEVICCLDFFILCVPQNTPRRLFISNTSKFGWPRCHKPQGLGVHYRSTPYELRLLSRVVTSISSNLPRINLLLRTTDMSLPILYDISSPKQPRSYAPNPSKARLALNFKQVAFSTEWVDLLHIETVRKGLQCLPTRKYFSFFPRLHRQELKLQLDTSYALIDLDHAHRILNDCRQTRRRF